MSGNNIPQPNFSIARIFLKDVSLEAPNAPEIFLSQWRPKVEFDLNTANRPLDADHYEVILTLTIKADNGDKSAFLIEVKQGGVFKVTGFEQAEHDRVLGAFCPSLLFPYAREAVDNLAAKANFPPLMLAPINFDAAYERQIAQNTVNQAH